MGKKISVVIPFKADYEELPKVLEHLLSPSDTKHDNLEIIVVNDGSQNHFGKFVPLELDYPNVKIINNSKSFGVGYSFDRGVSEASNDTIILMGCDVYAKEGWYEKVRNEVSRNPNSISCAVCVGDKPPYRKYYGADMLITMGNDDLPPKSKLRERRGGFTDLFRGKWAEKKGDEPYEISCLMGAFYWTSKAWYQKIGGFDTEVNNRFAGHRVWSHLEPHLSLKSYLHGGNCVLYPDIEATHLFNRVTRENKYTKGSRSAEWFHWNSQWILETMVINDFTRNRIRDFKTRELNLNVAEKMIKEHYDTVLRYRNRNRLEFRIELKDYMDKFNLKI